MAESPRFRTALAAALVAAPALARAGEVPPSLLTDDMLQRYRAERTCDGGPAYAQIRSSLRVEASAAQSARYMQRPELAQLEQRIANDYDRGCQGRGGTLLSRDGPYSVGLDPPGVHRA